MATNTQVPLTPGRIKNFKHDGRSRDLRWDDSNKSPTGFGVRVYQSGKRSYVLQYRPKEFVSGSKVALKTVRSKRPLKVLGDCALLSLSDARQTAHDFLAEVEVGLDLDEDRSLDGITLTEFLSIYMAIKEREGIAERSLYDIERRVRNYLLPLFGDQPLTAIKRSKFHDLYLGICSGEQSISGKPSHVEANRLHAHLSNIFKIAEIKGVVPEGASYPTRLVTKKRETARKRFLSDPELKRLYRVLEDGPQSHALYAIQLLLHQGMRKAEMLGLKWSNVHIDRVSGRECAPPHIFVGTTKNGDKMFSVLSPQAIQILEHLASQRTKHPAVFPSPVNANASIKDIRPQWKRIRAEAGLGNFNLHDLRHCVGTWLARLGKTELVISRTLNHRVKSMTERYALIPAEAQEEAVKDLANWLQEQVGTPIKIST